MAWLGAIGAYVAGAVGVTVAAGSVSAMVIGGMIVGAAVGGIYSAVTGGNIAEGLLYGAVGGAAIGYGAAVLGAGAAGGTGAAFNAGSSVNAGTQLAVAEGTYGAGTAAGAAQGGASLFTASTLQGVAAVGSMGAAFMKGGVAGGDRDAELALSEKRMEQEAQLVREAHAAAIKRAEISAGATLEGAGASAATADKNRAEKARQFDKNFAFRKTQYEEKRDYERKGKERFESGIKDATSYIKGRGGQVNIDHVQVQKARKEMSPPVWKVNKKPAAPAQPQPQGA